MNIGNQSDSQHKPNTVEEIIDEILKKSFGGNFIYRGESKCYEKVSSGLYRVYSSSVDIPGAIQESVEKILSDAKAYLGETDYAEILARLECGMKDAKVAPGLKPILDSAQEHLGKTKDFKILAELQHYGLPTNLIDFTQDYLVALFFASHKDLYENGRVIVLENKVTEDFNIEEAPLMIDRAVFQRSVFVEASEGFINIDQRCIVHICHTLKKPLQDYLEKYHGLSTKGIYNDIHGFIRSYDIYPSPYRKLLDGQNCFKNALSAKKREEQLQWCKKAIEIFTGILDPNRDDSNRDDSNRDLPEAYLNRGGAHFQLGEHYMEANEKDKAEREYDKAITDYKAVITQYPDYADAYAERGKAYNSMDEFQRALEDFDRAIGLDPNQPIFYFERAIIRLCRQEWDEARADLEAVGNQGVSLKHLFNQEIRDFEKRYGVVLPKDIAEMLT